MTVPDRVLEAARAELAEGVREATNRNDGVPAERYMRGDRLPWCAGFVLYVLDAAGVYTRPYWQLRSVNRFERWAKDNAAWIAPSEIPEPGDLFFLANREGSDTGLGRHMGIVESVDMARGRIRTIEGNVSNRVARLWRSLHRVEFGTPRGITGYARPRLWA